MKKAVVYYSGTGNTQAMAEKIAAVSGAELITFDEFVPAKTAEYDVLALGCPAMGAEVLEEEIVQPAFDEMKPLLKGKRVALFGSYGWGDGEWMRSWEKDCDDAGISLVCESITCCEAPDDDVLAACQAMGRKLAE